MPVGRDISARRGDFEIEVPGGVQAHQGQVPPPGKAWQRDDENPSAISFRGASRHSYKKPDLLQHRQEFLLQSSHRI